jgi:hypothetical protein
MRTTINYRTIDEDITRVLLTDKQYKYYTTLKEKLVDPDYSCTLHYDYETKKRIGDIEFFFTKYHEINEKQYIRTRTININFETGYTCFSTTHYEKLASYAEQRKNEQIYYLDITVPSISKLLKVIDKLYW